MLLLPVAWNIRHTHDAGLPTIPTITTSCLLGNLLARFDTVFFCLPLYDSAHIDINITDSNRKNFLEFDTSKFRVT